MFLFLTFFALSGTKVTNPPIEIKLTTISNPPTRTIKCTINDLYTKLLTIPSLTVDQCSCFVSKMRFAKSNSILSYSFKMDINFLDPNSRVATRSLYKITANKETNGQITISYSSVVAYANVKSQVITETSSTFLWWEFDKQRSIQWRPLNNVELDQVSDFLQRAAASQESKLRSK